MALNADKPSRWKADIARSVDYYNDWFMQFAPETYRATRVRATQEVESTLRRTANLANLTVDLLCENPAVLPMLRMMTAPPLARDRLIGLAKVSPNLVRSMELGQRLPPHMSNEVVRRDLRQVCNLIMRLADKDIFPWLESRRTPNDKDVFRAASIVADRHCGATADPIIRNAQEQRQLAAIKTWLEAKGYGLSAPGQGIKFDEMPLGTFSFRLNVPVAVGASNRRVNVPVDVAIMPRKARRGSMPILLEAKSAGDFTNTNKRRKEEATKVAQLRATYGDGIRYVLLLCGYFDSGYLGYEAAEGIDWAWEHRIDDLARLGL
jgi:hypothetical protein